MSDIPVLVYHRVGIPPPGAQHPDTYVHSRAFARQIALLKTLGYQTVGAEEYAKSMLGMPCRLPRKPILLTFDDGSSTVYSEALPVLKNQGFSAVIFMISSRMGQPASWDGETSESGHRQLAADELRALLQEGWSVGSHTVAHPRLTDIDSRVLEEQLTESRKTLEETLGREVDWFAYPYGDFNERVRKAVGAAGYRLAFATEEGDGLSLSIPRRVINGRAGIFRFLRRLLQARRLAQR